MTENEMARYHHPLSGDEFEQTPREWRAEEHSPWGYRESDTT